jgi:hypothetical protein
MNKLKDFFVKFFKQLKCEITEKEDCLIIYSVPQSFEKFSGKRGPYKFSFDKEIENYELISSNHYLIRTIKDFLEGHGETTLLKAKFDLDLKEELQKITPFTNSKIKSINKFSIFDEVIQFSFSTTFRYLNESKVLINKIFVREGKIIDDPQLNNLSEGDKKDLSNLNLEKHYEIAKEELKKIILPETEKLREELGERLSEEISRIEKLYEGNFTEIKEKEESIKKQIENNKENEEKRKRLEKNIENLQEENNLKNIKEEREEFIQKEIKKYGLRIDNKLINTTIICFPIYKLSLTLELEKDNLKIIELVYHPLDKKIEPIYCKSCGKELKEIILCSSGHLTCRECGDKCPSCGGIFCKSCFVRECSECGRKICQRCQNICSSCGKVFCNMHIRNVNGKKLCRSCERKTNEIKRY